MKRAARAVDDGDDTHDTCLVVVFDVGTGEAKALEYSFVDGGVALREVDRLIRAAGRPLSMEFDARPLDVQQSEIQEKIDAAREAANVRHLPEGMCYIFYCAASSLLVRDTTALNDATTEVPAPLYAWSRAKGEPVPAAELVAAAEGHYLQRVITPLFLYLQWQLSKRANDHISTRVMYDDVNETFWSRTATAAVGIVDREVSQVGGIGLANGGKCYHGTMVQWYIT